MFEKLQFLLQEMIKNNTLIQIILSDQIVKNKKERTKINIKPILIKEMIHFQFSSFKNNQVFHENVSNMDFVKKTLLLLENEFCQALICTNLQDYQVFVNRTGVSILKKKPTKEKIITEHNRTKNYLINEGDEVPFLVEIGIMDQNYRVLPSKYNKFKQINKFLEFIDDVVEELKKDPVIRIIDFGCGKSYLTFAMHHYLKEILHLNVSIIGLDLKEEVIEDCSKIVEKYHLDNLTFLTGDIEHYQNLNQVSMVVTLHACDTATDAALAKAIQWGAKVILSVPCCQHEFNSQISSDLFSGILEHGIMKERFSAMLTDVVRSDILQIHGYRTQIIEFIETTHTPKNLLIRAIKSLQTNKELHQKHYDQLQKEFHFDSALVRFLKKEKNVQD